MREIVFDTETTGLDCLKGDRLVELGCVELLNHIPTGRTFHTYINPRRMVSVEALSVHGYSDAFLADQPCFDAICAEFLDFIGDSTLVAHNAGFDRGFINMELTLCQRLAFEEHRFVDTLVLARRRHPNGPNSLDALCARYGIDTSARTKHSALLDARILAEVYLELLGGRQATLSLAMAGGRAIAAQRGPAVHAVAARAIRLPPRISEEDRVAHAAYVGAMSATSVWSQYFGRGDAPAAAA